MTPSAKIPQQLEELYQKAREAWSHAYAPYSHCQVGAAIRTSDGKIFSGCNVESASFGATICAERSAIVGAVTHAGKLQIQEILVLTDATPPWPPCGICRQLICEFVGAEANRLIVHTANLKGELVSYPWKELYPHYFGPSELETAKTGG